MRNRHGLARRVKVVVLGLLVVVSACSAEATQEEWRADWDALLEQIPPVETMLAADDDAAMDLCAGVLGTLRTSAEDLQRTPDADLETAAFAFVDFAEGVFFECPLHSGDHTGWEAGYAEMEHLKAAVEALLDD